MIELYSYQMEAIEKLRSGSILLGKTGSGKTLTALSFYKLYFSSLKLYVITTAKKRDTHDWENEAANVDILDITVDSWNNIGKYSDVRDSFIIFDEQKVSGYRKWAKTFIKIARKNKWILLSATPGDTEMDYISVFVANGFYKNKTDFIRQHVEYDPYVTKYPKIKAYHNIPKLMYLRKKIVVPMKAPRTSRRIKKYYTCEYPVKDYTYSMKNYWNVWENKPLDNASQYTQFARKMVNVDVSRIKKVEELVEDLDRVIIFYNYNYELEILKAICMKLKRDCYQWNGMVHEQLPQTKKWVYLCHYAACEGWNCITANNIIFYSLNYSYKIMEQAEGRIDRLNTPYKELYYHYMVSDSSIDKSILRILKEKKKFNERTWKG